MNVKKILRSSQFIYESKEKNYIRKKQVNHFLEKKIVFQKISIYIKNDFKIANFLDDLHHFLH